MKKVLVAAFVLFCGAVLVSQWRAATTAEKTRQIIAHRTEPQPEIEPESLSPREIRSPFRPLPRPRIVSISTNTSPERILVEYGGRWYPAEVVQSDGNQRLIHYTGYGNEWDEWVGPERIRDATDTTSVAEATSATDAQRLQPQAGDFVVKWGNRWWRAEPLQQKGDQTLIRYVGYGPEWDEWVTVERAKVFTETDAVADAVIEKEVVPLSGLDAVETATARPSANSSLNGMGNGTRRMSWRNRTANTSSTTRATEIIGTNGLSRNVCVFPGNNASDSVYLMSRRFRG